MERKPGIINSAFVFLSISILFGACGYLENDGTKARKTVVGNISILEYNNNDNVDLVFDEPNDITTVVVGDCRAVLYDTLNRMIYAEARITESTSNYYSIFVKDPSSDKFSQAFKKNEIDETAFKKGTLKTSVVELLLNR